MTFESITIKGVWGATYSLPANPQDIQANVCVIKKDGQKFYLPIADVRTIGLIIEAQISLIQLVDTAKGGRR